MKRSNSGASLLFFAIILVGIMTVLIALLAMFRTSTTAASSTQTVVQLEAAKAALEQFVSAAGRLPCPADPSLDTGVEAPAGGAATCAIPGGTIPWSTIGIRREDAIDTWGFKISYRVYTGNNGSLTQPGGASMVNCDTVEPAPGGRTALAGNAGGLCAGDPADPMTFNTTEAQFLAGKGLAVNDFGTNVTDAAFVLVSPGPSGRGAFTASGTATDPPGSVNEINNMSAVGPFVAAALMTANMSPDNANYFDDVIVYERLPDLIRRAKLNGRDWPELPPLASVRMDTATLTAALGAAPASDTGQSTINFSGASISGFSLGVATDIAFSGAGSEGVGVVGGVPAVGPVAGITGTDTAGEKVQIDLTQKARKFAIALDHFGTYQFFFGIPGTYTEKVEFTFFEDGVLKATVTKSACATVDGGLGSFSIDIGSGLLFNRVDVRPISTVELATAPTTFFISEFTTCSGAAISCLTSLDTGPYPAGNRCP